MEKPDIKNTATDDAEVKPVVATETQVKTDRSLSRKETRQIVTPYAFFVSDELLGTPLAGPFRRGFGLSIDLFFILLLTQLSSLVLAAVAALTFFRAGNRLKTKKRFNAVRIALRLGVAVLLFTVVMGIVDSVQEQNGSTDTDLEQTIIEDDEVDGMAVMALTAGYLLETKSLKDKIADKECQPAYACAKTLGEELIVDVVEVGLDKEAIESIVETYIASMSDITNAEELSKLTEELQQSIEAIKFEQVVKPQQLSVPAETVVPTPASNNESSSFIGWMENVAEELGLGLGWAAFYFSIFTAWWQGQTPGKKLLGMKVIKLDNKPLNLWESFGRYGGYAAGLATGLSGFLQVFWDPNRQAIQDKISETLVINLRKPKVPFNPEITE